jgi:hypothetical protein
MVKTRFISKTETAKVVLTLLAVCWIAASPARLSSQPAGALLSNEALMSAYLEVDQDPYKPASELNHHLAGYALIAIGLLVLAGHSSDQLRALQLVWPFLFVAAGLFLAAWSDIEIWPRGDLSWMWLIHHDAEARQHKIFAILLMGMGLVEYLRVSAKLSRFWRVCAFPLLALVGVGLLLSHDHGAGSGASSSEARDYVVSWLAEGNTETNRSQAAAPSDPPPAMHHHMMMSGSPSLKARQPQPQATAHEEMEMHQDDHGHRQHHMTASMLKVEREHMWFALVGAFVILFKVIQDGALWRRLFVPLLWPSCIVVLGMLLVFYRE